MKQYNTKEQIVRLAMTLIVLIILGGTCSYLCKESIETYGKILLETMGIYGLMLGTLITDTSPMPLTSEPFAILGLGADIPIHRIIIAMSFASHIAGALGYGLGRFINYFPQKKTFLVSRFPTVFSFMNRHGIKGVCLAAILPIPYAIATWSAGIVGIGFWSTFAASSLRWVKTTLYVSLLWFGWEVIPH
ncbi:MAG: hypothetical protein VX278_04285 [Myxococcota bacterium]|nr:hypothetical protein [Myxococcota bacterium]